MESKLQFGPFTLESHRRVLLRDGNAVALGSRAADILIFLASNAGQLKTNADIVKYVWPNTYVDEANLRVHISALRKALDDTKGEPKFIANVPGRGYEFIAKVSVVPVATSEGTDRPAPTSTPASLASAGVRIFGRDELVSAIAEQFSRSRLLTIVGPGGIGKSTVARAVVAASHDSGAVITIDFSQVENPALVPTSVASAIGILSRSEDLVRDIVAHFQTHGALVVMESCEHVVDAVAGLAEILIAGTSGLRILATSREPMRAEGERVLRIPPLELPQEATDAATAMQFAAVQLFVERADACLGGYVLTDSDAPHVIKICMRLDGIALAIELAAGRLETVGIKALAASLSDCFRVLTRGRRTALPRHQTLRATLDWSYAILPGNEQRAMRSLSVFRGWFDAEAAEAVMSAGSSGDAVASLVAKSLLAADTLTGSARFRLLDTTRLYAQEKLAEANETPAAMAAFTTYLCGLLKGAEQELYAAPIADWSRDFAGHVANIRSALEWTFAETGDPLQGVKLTVAALPLFFRLSLLDECLAAVTRAITFLEARPGLDEKNRMKLYAALGWPQMRATDAPEEGIAAWSTALKIAEAIGDVDHQLRAIWALWVDAINRAEPRLGLDYANRFWALAAASPDPTDAIIGRRMRGATLHWLGRHAESREQLERMIAEYSALRESRHSVRFQFDQKVTARIILARTLWVLGHEEDALREVQEAVDYAIDIQHNLSLSNVLAEAACPLALLAGRDELAARYIAMLREHTKALSLDVWHCYAECFEAELSLRQGRAEDCIRQLRSNMEILRSAGFTLFRTIFLSILARALSAEGKHTEALRTIDDALEHCDRSGERWCLAELHRVRAGILHADTGSDHGELVRDTLQRAMEAAREDAAAAWMRRIDADVEKFSAPSASSHRAEPVRL